MAMAGLKRTLFGYSSASVRSALSEREAALEEASKATIEAREQAESLSSELSETRVQLSGLEEQLNAAREAAASLTADLERSVAQRESIEVELREAKGTIVGRDEQLRAAEADSARLEEQLRQQAERLEQVTAEAVECQASLRALDESGGFVAAISAQQKRVAELEELVKGYRELIDSGGDLPAAPAEPSHQQETPTAPSTAGELAAVIEVAEQAVTSIMESTRVRADEELRAVEGERERISRDVDAMTAWRDRAAPVIVSLQGAMRDMQGQAAEIGLRVNEALGPVSNALTALTTQLASLGDLAVAPSDLSTEAPAPPEPDPVTELPQEHFATRHSSDG
jgi:chromosome segregation ATPase